VGLVEEQDYSQEALAVVYQQEEELQVAEILGQ
jgi:hypothetical protein